MYFNKKEFEQLVNQLREQICACEDELSSLKKGKLVCRIKNGKLYYSEVTADGEKVITNDPKRIWELTRIEFLKKKLDLLEKNEKAISYCLKNYVDDLDEAIMAGFEIRHPHLPVKQILHLNGKKELNKEAYIKNPYYAEYLKFLTMNGVLMRSKSEQAIGNTLESLGIEYVSDVLVKCGNNNHYVDFIIKRKNGTKVLWEHFGRENDTVYMAKNAVKINDYISLGYKPWEDLIWTLDSDIEDSRNIRRIIQRFILNDMDS